MTEKIVATLVRGASKVVTVTKRASDDFSTLYRTHTSKARFPISLRVLMAEQCEIALGCPRFKASVEASAMRVSDWPTCYHGQWHQLPDQQARNQMRLSVREDYR